MSLSIIPQTAQAIPVYARQTGQNCIACHAGGQYPELTAYGRLFKLTGYTTGSRTEVPLAMMAVASSSSVAGKTPGTGDTEADFPQNGLLHFTTASVFAGGKITDNLGLFGQWTYNAYARQDADGHWAGHSQSDQFDLRYADRFINDRSDLIVGASLNNNPGVTDVWNTFNSAFTSTPSYVPASNPAGNGGPFVNVPATPIMLQLGPVAAGIDAYAFWNGTIYGELGAYRTSNQAFSFLSQGVPDAAMPKLKGQFNPYWRLALNRDWGPHSAMIGAFGMNAEIYANSPATTGPTVRYRDAGIDAQYQYILDPHAFSAQFSYIRERQIYDDALWNPANPNYSANYSNSSNTLNYLRLKATYVYQAKYGTSLAYAAINGSADAALYANSPDANGNPVPFGNANGKPDTRLWVPEIFWKPIQYLRVGMQYYKFTEYKGSSSNYDGNGRSAHDNNTLFIYLWGAY
ncbi:MAG: cytochrome C [Burkholderiaceae bacterium]|nr:cytochrome C [Burkholderiaceae bacterium]